MLEGYNILHSQDWIKQASEELNKLQGELNMAKRCMISMEKVLTETKASLSEAEAELEKQQSDFRTRAQDYKSRLREQTEGVKEMENKLRSRIEADATAGLAKTKEQHDKEVILLRADNKKLKNSLRKAILDKETTSTALIQARMIENKVKGQRDESENCSHVLRKKLELTLVVV